MRGTRIWPTKELRALGRVEMRAKDFIFRTKRKHDRLALLKRSGLRYRKRQHDGKVLVTNPHTDHQLLLDPHSPYLEDEAFESPRDFERYYRGYAASAGLPESARDTILKLGASKVPRLKVVSTFQTWEVASDGTVLNYWEDTRGYDAARRRGYMPVEGLYDVVKFDVKGWRKTMNEVPLGKRIGISTIGYWRPDGGYVSPTHTVRESEGGRTKAFIKGLAKARMISGDGLSYDFAVVMPGAELLFHHSLHSPDHLNLVGAEEKIGAKCEHFLDAAVKLLRQQVPQYKVLVFNDRRLDYERAFKHLGLRTWSETLGGGYWNFVHVDIS